MSFFFFFSIWVFYILSFFFFFNDTATTEIYTLSLHDALPIYPAPGLASSAPTLLCERGRAYYRDCRGKAGSVYVAIRLPSSRWLRNCLRDRDKRFRREAS